MGILSDKIVVCANPQEKEENTYSQPTPDKEGSETE